MKSIFSKLIIFGLVSILFISASFAENGITKDEIVFGQSAAFKGSSAALGTELWRGAQAYIDHVNASGGVHGRKIRIKALDDSYNGNKTLINTINLIKKEKVFNLFGYVGTPTIVKALPAIQKFSEENVVLFSNFTGAQPQREKPHNKNVFNIRASYKEETSEIVKNLVALGHSKIAVFIQFDAYGRSGADGVSKELSKSNLKIVAEATYKRGADFKTDMAKQVKFIKESGATAVVSVGSYKACAAFIRDSRKMGFSGAIANVSFVGADSLLAILKQEEKASGTRLTHKLLNSQVVPPWTDQTIPLVAEYQKMMDQYNPQVPSHLKETDYKSSKYGFVSLEGFLNAKILIEILKRAPQKIDRLNFIRTIHSTKNLDVGLSTKVLFSKDKHQAFKKVFITTIENGEYVLVNNWNKFK